MTRKPVVPTLLAMLLLTAGCLGGVPTDDPQSSTTGPTSYSAADQPDPDKEVRVENAWDRTAEVRVRVIRVATNETVYDETLSLEPGADHVVYDVSEADPDGIESFRVVATFENTTRSVTIETSGCYGDAFVEISDEGELSSYYAIC